MNIYIIFCKNLLVTDFTFKNLVTNFKQKTE